MNKKVWTAEWSGNSIIVENGWDWSGNTEEKIVINGEIAQSQIYSLEKVSASRAMGTVYNLEYGPDSVRVIFGSVWYLFGVACRIEVNGKFIGGNRIVLFVKEQKS